MKYRYGDATPFPLDENFIDTISAAVDACVALFQADSVADAKRAHAYEVQKQAEDELRRLDVLAKAVEAAVRPMMPEGKPTRPSQTSAQKIVQGAGATLRNARAAVTKRRDAVMRAVIGDALSEKVFQSLETFLLGHQLPRSQWTLTWTSGTREGEAKAEAAVAAPTELRASFGIAIPREHRWTGPVKLGDLEPTLSLQLQQRAGFLRGPRTSREALHRYSITEVHIGPKREEFILRRNPKKPSSGFRVLMFSEDISTPTLTRIDEEGRGHGQPMTFGGTSAVALGRLWTEIQRAMQDLLHHRCRMDSAHLRDRPIRQLDEPAELAEAILASLAPFVRQMRLRSRVPGELVLKRDLGDGRREELFVPRREIERKYSVLTHDQRACFAAIGLGGEATREFVQRELPLAPPRDDATPGPAPAHPLARAQRLATESDDETNVAA